MKVAILICSFKESQYLNQTIDSLKQTIPEDVEYKLYIDSEEKRTGLANTTNRYMKLFEKIDSDVNYVVKSDDDVFYYRTWLENCVEILEIDSTIGYCSPISHLLMKKIGIRHASDNRIPIYANKTEEWYKEEPILSGMCWVMPISTWKNIPYNLVKTWHCDGTFAHLVRSKGYKLAAYNGALISHLGQARFKGLPSDRAGKPPSIEFKNKHPEIDFKIY